MIRFSLKCLLIPIVLFFFSSICCAQQIYTLSCDNFKKILRDLPSPKFPNTHPTIKIGLLQSVYFKESPDTTEEKELKKLLSDFKICIRNINSNGGYNGRKIKSYCFITEKIIEETKIKIKMFKKLKIPIIILDRDISENNEVKEMLSDFDFVLLY